MAMNDWGAQIGAGILAGAQGIAGGIEKRQEQQKQYQFMSIVRGLADEGIGLNTSEGIKKILPHVTNIQDYIALSKLDIQRKKEGDAKFNKLISTLKAASGLPEELRGGVETAMDLPKGILTPDKDRDPFNLSEFGQKTWVKVKQARDNVYDPSGNVTLDWLKMTKTFPEALREKRSIFGGGTMPNEKAWIETSKTEKEAYLSKLSPKQKTLLRKHRDTIARQIENEGMLNIGKQENELRSKMQQQEQQQKQQQLQEQFNSEVMSRARQIAEQEDIKPSQAYEKAKEQVWGEYKQKGLI